MVAYAYHTAAEAAVTGSNQNFLKMILRRKMGHCITVIEEGWREKQRQRSSHLFGGQNLFKFLAALGVFLWSIWKKRSNSSYFSKSTLAKTASVARN